MSLGLTGEWTDVVYEDNVVIFYFTMDEQLIDIDKLSANPDNMKASVLAQIHNDQTKPLFDLIIKADAGLRVVYKGKTSGKETELRLTANDLKQEIEKPMATAEEKLQLAIVQTNSQMPLDTGTGIIMTELVDKGDIVAYMAHVTDKEQFKFIANSVENVKNNQQMIFKMCGPAEKAFFQLIADANKSLGYIYYTEGTDETVEIIHTNAELREMLK